MPAGRPTDYTPDLAQAICTRIAENESLRSICRDEAMPAKATVFVWLSKHQEFQDHYARAQEMAADGDADDVAHYARLAADGDIEPAAATAAINGLKWSAGKRKPKKYGEALQMKHSGAIGVFDPSKHSDDELRTLLGILEPAAVPGPDGDGDQGGTGEAGG